MTQSWPSVLSALLTGRDLDVKDAAWAMGEMLSGQATDAQIAGFVVALRAKGETVDELRGLVDAMYQHTTALDLDERVVDIVGTGGDLAKTVNISSMAAVTVAGAGIGVVKHGNRAASSASGTADVFERLGVRLDVPPERVLDVYREAGITFCFAQVFHPALRHVGPARRELGVPTVFNFLGPLANPARPAASAIGCWDTRMAPLMAAELAGRGGSVLVFRGDDGLDEITVTTTTRVWVPQPDGSVAEEILDPTDFGIELAAAGSLSGGDAAHNADVFRRYLQGESGPVRDAVLLNAAAAIAAHDAHDGPLVDRLRSALTRATASVDSGAARETLARWVEATDRHAG